MFKTKWKCSYFKYSFLIAVTLSVITLIVTFLYPSINLRLLYLFFYFLFFNFIVLLGVAFIANSVKEDYYQKISKFGFIILTLFYSIFYILSSLCFVITGQSIKLQGILFIYKINPWINIFLLIIGAILVMFLLTLLIYKKINFQTINSHHDIRIRYLFISSTIIFIIIIFFILPILGIENNIVKIYSDGDLPNFNVKELDGENILDSQTQIDQPNVIFILLESVSTDRISFYGYERNVTPNIDKLAQRGIVFQNAYTTATHSDYAQPAYLSSNFMLNNDYRNFFDGDKNQNAIWQVFKENNYTTYYFSSQDDLWAGMNQYFDYSALDEYWYSLTDDDTDYGSGLGKKDYDHKTMDKALSILNSTHPNYLQNKINQTTNESCFEQNTTNCSSQQHTPFFMYLNFQATHSPPMYPKEYAYYLPDASAENLDSREELESAINTYDNSLRYVDAQIGRLLDYLNETKQLNETVIIISADHGEDLYGLHNSFFHGYSIYEDEIRVPLIFVFPDITQTSIESRVSHIDVLPTVLNILKIQTNKDFRGGAMTDNDRLFFCAQNHMYLIGMIEGDLKVIIDLNRNLVEVYNLKEDPSENKNIVSLGDYDQQILTLLMWHNCQINYFGSKNKQQPALEKYCSIFNKQ